jgi:hypothetical protein
MAVGTYVGAGTVGAAAWWYMISPTGPHLSYYQLSHHLQCTPENEAFKVRSAGVYFGDALLTHNALLSLIRRELIVPSSTIPTP